MDEQQLIELLKENISFQLRHAAYERTIEVRNFSISVTTDEGQEKEVTRYRRYEEDELKAQRNRLYNSYTGAVINSLRKNWKRMARVEGIRKTAVSANETALMLLEDSLYNFMPGESLTEWLNRMLEHYQVTDPNKWVVYERRDVRNQEGQIIETRVWPFEVDSVHALNFEYEYGELRWFLCRTVHMENVISGGVRRQKMLEDYFLYTPGYVIRAREVGEKTKAEPGEEIISLEVLPAAMPDATTEYYIPGKNTRSFYLKVIQNGTTEVPAMIGGAYMDESNGHASRVPWFWPGKGLLRDLIKLKSSLDVTLTVHTYPRRWEFTKACTFTHAEMGECVAGYLNGIRDTDHQCPKCGGTGQDTGFTTEQATVKLVLPEDAEKLIELQSLAFTEPVDTSVPELLQTLLDRRTEQFIQAIFLSESHQKPDASGAKTAFEVARINEGVHDALTTYGKHFARHVELAYRIGAQYREFELESIDYSFPEDLQIETLAEMMEQFKQAKETGVGYEVMEAIRRKVRQKTFEGDPETQAKIEARDYFLPFADKSPEDVAMIIASRSDVDSDVVLYQNFRAIFQEIEEADPDFYRYEKNRQRQIIAAKVDEYKERIEMPEPDPDPMAMPAPINEPDPEPMPAE